MASSYGKWPLATKKERKYLATKLATSRNPAEAIREYQQERSLHAMMAKAFGTVAKNQETADTTQVVESLDTDSVLEFLSHFGLSRLDIHKRVSDALRAQLEEEIRKVQETAPLLKLLGTIWRTATKVPELRPVVWAILKKLGPDTPIEVLRELTNQDAYSEMWPQLPPLLKRLVWETDWDERVGVKDPEDPKKYYKLVESTLFSTKVQPIVDSYCSEKVLVDSANKPFVASLRERRMVTSHRRALLKGEAAFKASDVTNAVSEIRQLLAGETSAYRPKLLNAFLSILMARHGLVKNAELLGGSSYLHCTLIADILLSGPLPKAYQHLLTLARTLDEVVKAGFVSDMQISQIQTCLRQIYPTDEVNTDSSQQASSATVATKPDIDDYTKDTLHRIITSGLEAMKEADPQSLFLNPVTDAIAPGYSRVIKQPMCIKTMESKIDSYQNLQEWERDVKLVFSNCIKYNTGNAGQWFRGEARRQNKVFLDDIYPQALKLHQSAVGKRSFVRPKRKRDADGSSAEADIEPLPEMKGKMQKKEVSLPALASMLLADPFVVRILLDRALRCLRIDINRGSSIPAAHRVLPSILQLLHIASWSTRLCAIRGKLYAVPNVGMIPPTEDDILSLTPFATLRSYSPVLMRLLVESELDRRMAVGGDLQLASHSMKEKDNSLSNDTWDDTTQLDVLRSLTENALVHICQPGNTHESSLPITFPKFDKALVNLSTNLWNQRPFFISLIQALLRHKSKLSRSARDVIVASWLEWLGPGKTRDVKKGSMTSASHECFALLLNEWAALGNLLLPRDAMLTFAADAVRAANSSENRPERKFGSMWNKPEFASVQKQYERMFQYLPESQAQEWKDEVGILKSSKGEDEDVTMTEAKERRSKGKVTISGYANEGVTD